MDFKFFQQSCLHYWRQRNGYLVLAVGCLLLSLLLTIVLSVQVSRQRIVVLPSPAVSTGFWVNRQGVSSSYLGQSAGYLASLRLNFSPETVSGQYQHLLTFVWPAYRRRLTSTWQQEMQTIKTEGMSQVFYAYRTHVNPSTLAVTLVGKRQRFLHQAFVDEKTVQFHLRYRWHQGQLWLAQFKEEKVNA